MSETTAPRIPVTHVGSLPRSDELADLLIEREEGRAVDEAALQSLVEQRVAHVVARQKEAGIDIGNDGEQGRTGFQTNIAGRMSGFGGESARKTPRDYTDFPQFAALIRRRLVKVARIRNAPRAVGEVSYDSLEPLKADCDMLELAAGDQRGGAFRDVFLSSPSPGILAMTLENAYYDTYGRYVRALAREMCKEYEYILSRGFILQIDAPDLAMERCTGFQDRPLSEFLEAIELHVDALNEALAGLATERVRMHCCWGNWDGPHLHDVDLAEVLPVIYRAGVGGLSIPFANPRHQHELAAIEANPLPEGRYLLPGVIDTTTSYVEHPEVVAERLIRAARAAGGPERIVASTDCGFGSFAGYQFVAEDVVWAKLAACRQGADLAAERLYGSRVA